MTPQSLESESISFYVGDFIFIIFPIILEYDAYYLYPNPLRRFKTCTTNTIKQVFFPYIYTRL